VPKLPVYPNNLKAVSLWEEPASGARNQITTNRPNWATYRGSKIVFYAEGEWEKGLWHVNEFQTVDESPG
jgi:hypothetical protein